MKNVLFVVPSLRRAGAETQVVDLVNGLDPGRFRKYLFTFAKDLDLANRVDRSTVRVLHTLRRSKFDLRVPLALGRAIDEHAIDIVHCSLQFSVFVAWLARLCAKRTPALVAAIHTTVNRDMKHEIQDQLLYRMLLRACRAIIFVCNNQRAYWGRRFPFVEARSAVVYNGVDLEHYRREPQLEQGRRLRSSLSIPENAAVVACVAGFRPEKGHRYLIQAFSGLTGSPYLLLAGEGEKRLECERQVIELGLSERVKFLGNVIDIRPVLAASNITVLASTAVETFSMAMLESMAMEVPVVVPDIGGLSEAVEPGVTGELTKPGDVAMLEQALGRMLSNSERAARMGAEARRRVAERFSATRMIRDTEAQLLAVGA